ncbi:hypothetical protein Tco_1184814 [Tanacetum coccineum]
MEIPNVEVSPCKKSIVLSKMHKVLTLMICKRMQNVPYASVVGSIMYAVRCTRPDVAFTQNITRPIQQIQSSELDMCSFEWRCVDGRVPKQSIYATSSTEASICCL